MCQRTAPEGTFLEAADPQLRGRHRHLERAWFSIDIYVVALDGGVCFRSIAR
jgi:hypothetical protein